MPESEIARLAAEEAARAEADDAEQHDDAADDAAEQHDDADDAAEQHDETQDNTAQPSAASLTPEQIEARTKSWDRERDRHFRELQKRDDRRYDESDVCPLCEGHGLYFPQLPEPVNSARRQAITEALGGSAEPEYPLDPNAEPCAVCDATGKLRTGSRAPGQETHVCAACSGQGWKQRLVVPTANVPQPSPTLTVMTGGAVSNGQQVLDPWQRPLGHPHFGVAPAEVGI